MMVLVAHGTHVYDFQESAENPMWIIGTSGEFLPFHTGHGVLKTRILECFAISSSSQFSSVNQSCLTICDLMDCSIPGFPVHHQLLEPTKIHVHWWCHPTISSSVVPFSSCLQSFPAWGSFPMSGFFTSGGQSMGASASASVLPVNIQDWFLLGLTGWISLQSKGLSRVFSNTRVQKHEFFSSQLSL